MSRATRRLVVAHLAHLGMNPGRIAGELGISRDTVRRDLGAAHQDASPDAQADAAYLLLPEEPQLARNLDVLCAAYKARPEDAARFAIHQAARHVRAWQAGQLREGRRTT